MANAKVIASKQQAVEKIAAKLKESSTTVVADYRGLNVAQVTELRKQLREAGVDFQVLKNSLVSRAAASVELGELESVLSGPTAVAFGKDIVDQAQIQALANLPSREGLLSMLLSVLQAPMRNVALAVKAVADKNEATA
jgi:large subunit ribosomal protein L10